MLYLYYNIMQISNLSRKIQIKLSLFDTKMIPEKIFLGFILLTHISVVVMINPLRGFIQLEMLQIVFPLTT